MRPLLDLMTGDVAMGAVRRRDLPRLAAGRAPETRATSTAAAADARETQRAQVLEVVRQAGLRGATDDEIQTALGLDGSSERPRRWELWKRDRIRILREPNGAAVTRRTRTTRRAVVWILNPEGVTR
jgi:hypothetical protein